jgi:hypothetical protein
MTRLMRPALSKNEKAGHTPGPWRIDYGTHFGSDERYFRGVVGPDGEKIVLEGFALAMSRGNGKPADNSFLVVRAVNAHHAMLEALKLALDEIHHPGAARADGKDATALIEAAIAKAESPSNV